MSDIEQTARMQALGMIPKPSWQDEYRRAEVHASMGRHRIAAVVFRQSLQRAIDDGGGVSLRAALCGFAVREAVKAGQPHLAHQALNIAIRAGT